MFLWQFATKEMFDDARRDLEDDGEIVTTGNVIRPVATWTLFLSLTLHIDYLIACVVTE